MGNKEILRHTFAEIHLDHIRHNIRVLKELVPDSSFFCPMVKSNGYGHGDREIVQALMEEGVQHVGVALVEEGVRLRKYGFDQLDILVFGVTGKDGEQAICKNDLTPVISSFHQLQEFNSLAKSLNKKLDIHLKFNTGMYRLGFEMDEVDAVVKELDSCNQLRLAGVCSHLSDGEDIVDAKGRSAAQIEKFQSLKEKFSDLTDCFHLLNSSGFLGGAAKGPEVLSLGVRPGIAIYGVDPVSPVDLREGWSQLSVELKPGMVLKSEVVKYHHVPKGSRVSYGGKWQAEKDSVIGVVPIGYADGYSRAFSNKGLMLFRGHRVPVVGTVCMDYVMIDLTGVLGDKLGSVGEEVVLFGSQEGAELTVSEVAKIAETIPYELLTCIGRRVPRQYITGSK